jgi:uncharacterized membrane protein
MTTTKRLRRYAAPLLAAGVAAACTDRAATGPEILPPDAPAAARKPAADYRYTTVHVPGSVWTRTSRMNARGDIVGDFLDADGVKGYLLAGGSFHTIMVPGATITRARGINERGEIAGVYTASGRANGFLLSGGEFTTINVPGALHTSIWDINTRGDVTGEFQAAAGGPWFGFVWRRGTFTMLNIPGATMSSGFGINVHGDVVGHYRMPDADAPGGVTKMLGFIWRDGDVTRLDHPVPNGMSCSMGIGAQWIVGHYLELASGIVYGYVWQNGAFTATLRVPGAWETFPTSITSSGTIAGYYYDADWKLHGFIAEPVNPAGR